MMAMVTMIGFMSMVAMIGVMAMIAMVAIKSLSSEGRSLPSPHGRGEYFIFLIEWLVVFINYTIESAIRP